MECDQVKTKIRAYLEDLLPEIERMAVRQHLYDCPECAGMEKHFGTLAGDLHFLNQFKVPDVLKNELLEMLNINQFQSNQKSDMRPFGWMAVILILAAAIGSGLYFFQQKNTPNSSSTPQSAHHFSSLNVEPKTLPLVNAKASLNNQGKHVIHLKPFHWDINFPTPRARENFLAYLRKPGYDILYEGESLIVIELERQLLKALTEIISDEGGKLKRGGDLKRLHLPEGYGKIRIIIAAFAPRSRALQALAQHWHVRFELPNRFSFKGDIEDLGGKFLYESNEVWAIEIPGQQMEALLTAARTIHGLSLRMDDSKISTKGLYDIPIALSIYIEEG